jgi:hypothetical protein
VPVSIGDADLESVARAVAAAAIDRGTRGADR